MPFSTSGRRISMEQYERDEDVWPPRLPARTAAELEARKRADHERARAEAKEQATMDRDELAFERESDAAAPRTLDVKEHASTEALLEQLHRKDP